MSGVWVNILEISLLIAQENTTRQEKCTDNKMDLLLGVPLLTRFC